MRRTIPVALAIVTFLTVSTANPVPLSSADIFWSEHTVDQDFGGDYGAYPADIDGDGDQDVLATEIGGPVTWWENTVGDGRSWTQHVIPGDVSQLSTGVYPADVDSDGDVDAVGVNGTGIFWWENLDGDGEAWLEHRVGSILPDGAETVHAADLDGDGDVDLLAGAVFPDFVAWWENSNGDGLTWTRRLINREFGATLLSTNDLDGDGDSDVLGVSDPFFGRSLAWFENATGNGRNWTQHLIDTDPSVQYYSADSADVDGDGDLDVVAANPEDDEIVWWENSDGGALIWTKNLVDGDFPSARAVTVADIDGDGDPDVVGGSRAEGDVSWWENKNGDGSAWEKQQIDEDFRRATNLRSADINGDGHPDVLGAAQISSEVTWWENRGSD